MYIYIVTQGRENFNTGYFLRVFKIYVKLLKKEKGIKLKNTLKSKNTNTENADSKNTRLRTARLRNALLDRNMTQRTAGDRSGVPEAYISMYFHGKYLFTEEQKDKLAIALDFPKTELFDEAPGWPYEKTTQA